MHGDKVLSCRGRRHVAGFIAALAPGGSYLVEFDAEASAAAAAHRRLVVRPGLRGRRDAGCCSHAWGQPGASAALTAPRSC